MIYNFMLTLRYPVEKVVFDEQCKNDVVEAVAEFNRRYNGNKLIKGFDVGLDYVKLDIEAVNATTHDISAFSKFLYHTKNWKRFSMVQSRLFKVDIATPLEIKKDKPTVVANFATFKVDVSDSGNRALMKKLVEVGVAELVKGSLNG